MNILEHDSEGKFYHEYRAGTDRGDSTEDTTSPNGSSGTGFVNGLHSQSEYPSSDDPSTQLALNSGETSSKGCDNSKGTFSSSSRPLGGEDIMDGGDVNNPIDCIDVTRIKEEDSASNVFTCEKCGKAAYDDGEFETIKLGDIFTHVTQFPTGDTTHHHHQQHHQHREGPRLCAQCLNCSHFSRGSTATHHNLLPNTNNHSNPSVINNSCNTNTVVVTSLGGGSPAGGSSEGKSGTSMSHGEGSPGGQLLQGVSTIIMQNSNHHPAHHQHAHLQSNYQPHHNLQSPPPPQSLQEMHHDPQHQHFYQGSQLLTTQQQQQQPEMRGIKIEQDDMVHSQTQHLDNFMLIHDSAMYSDNNDSLQQQQLHDTIVSFHQPDNHLHQQQQRQQVICDNQQSQQQQHQSTIQHIAVVTPPGSDIKYTIPTGIMQMQGKEQGGVTPGQGQHLIQFSGQSSSLLSLPQHSDNSAAAGNGSSSGFRFLDVSGPPLDTSKSPDMKPPFSNNNAPDGKVAAVVVTHTTTTTSSISTPSTITTLTTTAKPKPANKSRSKSSAAAGPSSGAKGNNAQENPKIPCDLCKKKFKNPKMAMNHYKRVHQKEARFVCEICGAVFSYRGSLDSHLASHKPPEKTHDCEKCDMKFSLKANLRQHMRIHSDNPKKFPCDFCPSGFSKRVNLRYHIKRKHPDEAEKMNNNNNCKDSTSGAGNPQAGHAGSVVPGTTTTGSSPGGGGGSDNSKDKNQGSFKCEHCDRAFLFKNNLKAHLRTHTRDKKYTCELCGKSFIYKESLKNHMLLHSNEMPYSCDICGKHFRDRSNRRKHVKNVHKYLFVNGDINSPLKPGSSTTTTAVGADGTGGAQAGPPSSGEPPKKKARKSSKKAEEAGPDEGGGNKTRTIIKSPAAPRGKKGKGTTTPAAGSAPKATSNAKSVIVSASATTSSIDTKLDRKIIMSPSPKNSVGSPSSLEYVHSHSSLPVTVHVPLAGAQGQFSHGRNIIVKAASSATSSVVPPNHQSPPALSPEMYHHSQHPQQHGRGGGVVPASMQQNVIVYPKPKIPEQYPNSSSSVISQTMQQHPAQHQYYVSHEQQHHHHSQQQQQGYSYLQLTSSQPSPVPQQSSLMSQSHLSSPNPSAFEYVLGSTNLPSSDSHGNGSQPPMEIQVVNAEYSHLYPTDPNSLAYEQHHQQQQHYHWTSTAPTAPPGLDHGTHPPNSSSPYQLVAPPAGSNGSSSSGLVSEGSHPHGPPVSLAQSYDSSGMNPTSSVLSSTSAVYATGVPQGHEVLDPSGNGGNFFYKEFDFSYL